MSGETHWRQISDEPNCDAVQQFLRDRLASIYAGNIRNALEFTTSFVSGEDVLDIGVVAHTIDRANSPDWKHGIIKQHAKSVIGIDILEDEVKRLNAKGYDIRVIDATGDHDMGIRFSRIVIGDVIEHVNNPVALLEFAKRHLAPGGKILCSTPNPFFLERIYSCVRNGWFISNADHVTWISPTMALELGHRAGLVLAEVWSLRGVGLTTFRRMVVRAFEMLGWGNREVLSSAYYYVFRL